MKTVSIIFLLPAILILGSCSGSRQASPELSDMTDIMIPPNRLSGGASGMDQMDNETFVGIYDLKTYADGPRVVVIKTLPDQPLKISPIIIKDWKDSEGKPTDLESICRIGKTGNEFLMAEAGTWQGNYGRLFHLSIDTSDNTGTILGVVKLPFLKTNDFDQVGDQYEGLACISTSGSKATIILAERGGSEAFPIGILRWGTLDLQSYTLSFTEEGMSGVQVEAPGNWVNPKNKRDITALHIDQDNFLWASASQDIGDSGPFYSVIYQVGMIEDSRDLPIKVFDNLRIWREISGYKIEALSGPSSMVPNSSISFATEDEAFGGNWRAIE